MSDEAVTTTTTETTAHAPAPAAPARPESISEQMERLGWDPKAKHDANPNALGAKAREAEKAEKTKGKKGAEKPRAQAEAKNADISENDTENTEETASAEVEKPKEATDPLAPKREQLKTLIAELGLMLEDGRVTSKERAEIRVARKQAQEQLAANERESMARVEAAIKQLEERETGLSPREAKLTAFEKAVASGDHEEIAKAAGFESYDALQEHVIALKQDPAYKRLRALEKQAEERAKADAERAEREAKEADERKQVEEKQRATQAELEARRVYMADLTSKMSASEDPIVKAMADDPAFVGAVFRVQQENWDGGATVMRPEDAINKPARGQSLSLRGELERLYKKLAPVFGSGSAPSASAPKVAAKPEPVARPTRGTPPTPKAPAPSVKRLDEQEWKRQAQARMEEAAREEAIQRRGRRTG